jgi:hypothetical protein
MRSNSELFVQKPGAGPGGGRSVLGNLDVIDTLEIVARDDLVDVAAFVRSKHAFAFDGGFSGLDELLCGCDCDDHVVLVGSAFAPGSLVPTPVTYIRGSRISTGFSTFFASSYLPAESATNHDSPPCLCGAPRIGFAPSATSSIV